MRKLLLTTAAVAAAIAGAVAGETDFGTFTDTRDGQTYRTVIMGGIQAWVTVVIGGKKWMAENLNYETQDSSWCYENSIDNCIKYGRLYAWNAAKKACPVGWYLPTKQDWDNLAYAVGGERDSSENYGDIIVGWRGAGEMLKTKTDWMWNNSIDLNLLLNNMKRYRYNVSGNGTDDYGFSALPSGCRNDNGRFSGIGHRSFWYSTAEIGSDSAHAWSIYHNADYLRKYYNIKNYAFSVRCVADNP